MSIKYEYSLAEDFPHGLESYQLLTEILIDITNCDRVDTRNDAVKIWFDSSLSESDISKLDDLVSAHYPFAGEDLAYQLITFDDSPSTLTKAYVKCDTSDGNITINLQKAKRVKNIKYLITKNMAANTVIINASSGEYIDGWATKNLTGINETLTIESDGKKWNILDNSVTIDTKFVDVISTVTEIKGQMVIDSGNDQQPLNVGSDGQTLIADSTQPLGVKWGTVSGGSSIFGSEFQYAESDKTSSTTSDNYEIKLVLTTNVLPPGTYRIGISAEGNLNQTKHSLKIKATVGENVILDYYKEPKDSSRYQYDSISSFKCLTLSGSHKIVISYGTNNKKATASIRNARIEIWRIA